MTRLMLSLLLVLIARVASAQTGAIVSATFDTYAPGVDPVTGTPTKTLTLLLANPSVRCGQPLFTAPPPVPPFIPKTIVWTDPADATKDCLSDQPAFFQSLTPLASGQVYVSTLTFVDDRGLLSSRSGASNPFPAAPGNPRAPTGLQVR